MKPTTGHLVRYVGKMGVHAHRAAMVTMADDTWIREGDIEPLDSDTHVHLWVYTPGSDVGGFPEMNIPHDEGKAPGTWHWPPRS